MLHLPFTNGAIDLAFVKLCAHTNIIIEPDAKKTV